jgi:hypothetical protein
LITASRHRRPHRAAKLKAERDSLVGEAGSCPPSSSCPSFFLWYLYMMVPEGAQLELLLQIGIGTIGSGHLHPGDARGPGHPS